MGRRARDAGFRSVAFAVEQLERQARARGGRGGAVSGEMGAAFATSMRLDNNDEAPMCPTVAGDDVVAAVPGEMPAEPLPPLDASVSPHSPAGRSTTFF